MAVYTKISHGELEKHLLNYRLGDLIKFDEIIDGIDNSNFVITTSKGKYILTIFESRIDNNTLPYFIDFKEHLFDRHIPCPQPIKNIHSQNIVSFKNKNSAIVSFLTGASLKPSKDGYYRNITSQHCAEIGTYLAKMHIASQDFKPTRSNDLNIAGIENLYYKFKNLLPNYDPEIDQIINRAIKIIHDNWQSSLPSASCHLDLFPDNVFFDNNHQISAIIDFYFSAQDLLIYDLAITINAWCFDVDLFNHEKFLALLKSYSALRKPSQAELDFLNCALICASLRFLTTRLHDYFFTPKGSLVKVKDPQEYKNKLLFFMNNLITKFYD